MVFPSEQEQIEKFEKDHVAQHYFEVLRTLISKKSVFAQQVGLKEVANYLGEIFKRVGAEVEIDETYTAPFVMAHFKSSRPDAKTLIRASRWRPGVDRESFYPFCAKWLYVWAWG